MIPWRPVVTVAALTSITLTAMVLRQDLVAAGAAGALASYLGRLNGKEGLTSRTE